MSIYTDRKYINLLSSRLDKFKNKGNDTWNFRCPYCGDSKKNKIKARGYFYRKDNEFYYKCWNCNVGTTLNKFLKDIDSNLQKQYKLERYLDSKEYKKDFSDEKIEETLKSLDRLKKVEIPQLDLSEICSKLQTLDTSHKAIKYVTRRKIPKSVWNYFVYVPDFKVFASKFDEEKAKRLYENEERLAILFYDQKQNLIGTSGRLIDNDDKKIKYITIKTNDSVPKIFGLDKLPNIKEDVFVFEGPIDAMFLDNSIATADSDLTTAAKYVEMQRLVLVYDNQPRNKDIVKQMTRAIEAGFRICIWPKKLEHKDVNDMIIAGYNDADIYNIIRTNTVSGMKAKLRLTEWKSV